MEKPREIDKREELKVVTDNRVINAQDLSSLSLNARKLFYVAVSQCRQPDKEFFEFETTPAELAEMWEIDRSNVYREADEITTELMKIVITLRTGEKAFEKKHLFEKCQYDDDSRLTFKLHREMTELLLGVKKNFSQPQMWDFMKMRSPYSIAIWHLMQREMKSFKPMMSSPIIFDLTLEELRQVTGCEKKLKQIGQFKERVLDKAIKEIRKNCFVEIGYINLKKGRIITGFRFTAESVLGTVDMDNLTYRQKKMCRRALLVNKKSDGNITPEEMQELEELTEDLIQIHMEDIQNGYIKVN